MPISKNMSGDNIIPFMLRDQRPTSRHQKEGYELEQTPHPKKTTSQTSPTPEQNKEYVRLLASKGKPTQELIDECAPAIVRRIIKHVRKRNRPNNLLRKTLPKALRRQLQLLCDFDHPAGITLRDWLDGNLHTLPDGFEEAYAHSSNRKDISHDKS